MSSFSLSWIQKSIYSAFVFFGTLVVLSLVYAATTYYSDLPNASSGSGLTATNWNNLVNYANKAVKQDTEVLTVIGGNVGIGTVNPWAKLQISSTGNTSTSYTARFQSNPTIPGAWGVLYDQNSTNSYKLHTESTGGDDGFLKFSYITQVTGTVKNDNILVLRNGNVGIGTANPWTKLEVSGDIKAQNAAKAWVAFAWNGTILSSYNVSSVTKNSTGRYTVNFINAFANTNYAVVSGGVNTGNNDGGWVSVDNPAWGKGTASCKIATFTNTTWVYLDYPEVYVVFYGS